MGNKPSSGEKSPRQSEDRKVKTVSGEPLFSLIHSFYNSSVVVASLLFTWFSLSDRPNYLMCMLYSCLTVSFILTLLGPFIAYKCNKKFLYSFFELTVFSFQLASCIIVAVKAGRFVLVPSLLIVNMNHRFDIVYYPSYIKSIFIIAFVAYSPTALPSGIMAALSILLSDLIFHLIKLLFWIRSCRKPPSEPLEASGVKSTLIIQGAESSVSKITTKRTVLGTDGKVKLRPGLRSSDESQSDRFMGSSLRLTHLSETHRKSPPNQIQYSSGMASISTQTLLFKPITKDVSIQTEVQLLHIPITNNG